MPDIVHSSLGATTRNVAVVSDRLGLLFYPKFSIPGGIYDADTEAPLSLVLSSMSGVVKYTNDGSAPIKSSTQYATPIEIGSTTTIKAQAWLNNLYSYVAQRIYTILSSSEYTENGVAMNGTDELGWNATDTLTFGRTEV